ncbi:MAG: cytochrome c [Acidobacteria bacterium]|nr:cytochrome c [Acidobacteriota bacterium]
MRNIALLLLLLLMTVVVVGIGNAKMSGKGDAQAGAALYKQHCLRCHGEQGKGDGLASKVLNPKPHDFSDKPFMAKLSDEDLFKTIAKGGAAVGKAKVMPAYEGKLKEKDINDVVAFVRSLAQK